MNRKESIVALVLLLAESAISGIAYAKPLLPTRLLPDNATWVGTLSIGPAWTNTNRTQTFYLQDDIVKTYDSANNTSELVTGEFFWGMQRPLNEKLIGQLGLAVALSDNAKLTGDIWEDADPNFNNFIYNYKVNQVRVAVKGKLLAQVSQMIQPYISGSVGVGINRSHSFTINPKIFEEIPAPPFHSNTTESFSYTVGVGLQKSITEHWQVGIGYEFADWGKSSLSRATGQTLNSGLSLSHLYTQELQFSLSYVA